MANRFLSDFENDEKFIKNLYNEINSILNSETQKPEDEMDMDLINDCVDALLYLEHYDENAYSLTDKTVKKFHTRLQVTRLLRTSGTLVAALIIAIAVIGISLSSNNDSYISEVETTTHVAAVETTTDKKDDTTSTTKKNKEKSTSASSKTKKNTSSKKKKSEKKTNKKKEKEGNGGKQKTAQASQKENESTTKKPSEINEESTTGQKKNSAQNVTDVKSLKLSFRNGFQTVYSVGDVFNPKGIAVICVYSNGKTKTVSLSECSVSGFDSSEPGTKTVVVSYGGKTASFRVSVEKQLINKD